MLFQALTGQGSEFREVNRSIPYVGHHRSAPALLPGEARLIKTHEPYLGLYRKAVYLVRDPRDVVLSEHRFEQMFGQYSAGFESFFRDFLAARLHGLGSWEDHVASWLESGLDSASLLVVRFEDLRRDPTLALREVVRFLGLEVDAARLRAAVTENTLQRMRLKEDRAGLDKTRAQLRHVHRGAVGGWRAELSAEQVRGLENRSRRGLSRLGYALAHPWPEHRRRAPDELDEHQDLEGP
jgi:Sulfotransferase domain